MTIEEIIENGKVINLDIGCGGNKQPGFIGMDKRPLEGVDIVHDLEVFPYPIPDGICNTVVGSHIIEHVKPWLMIDIMNEIWRILKVGGKLALALPYGVGHGFVQDPTHCFDSKTEVLTQDGWKLLSVLTGDELILTMNPETQKTEYDTINSLIKEPFIGDMLHFESKKMDVLVTKNHDLYFASSGKRADNWQIGRADSFINKPSKSRIGIGHIKEWTGSHFEKIKIPFIKGGGNNAAKKLPIEFEAKDLMRFLGWYISEGCRDQRDNYYRICIYQSKKANYENYEEIKNLIIKMGFSPQLEDNRISFSSKDMFYFLEQFGQDCYSKKIPSEIKNYSKELLIEMLSTLIKGDGRKNNKSFEYASTSIQLADDVQEISLKCGYRSTLYKKSRDGKLCNIEGRCYPQKDIYLVSICKNSPVYYKTPKLVEYSGNIYCVLMNTNHIILTRRNGKVIWAGNCNPCNETTWEYFDPNFPLYNIYNPKPWAIEHRSWQVGGFMEVVLRKIEDKKEEVKDAE